MTASVSVLKFFREEKPMKNLYNALIVDDERLARQDLKDLLKECENNPGRRRSRFRSHCRQSHRRTTSGCHLPGYTDAGRVGFELLEKTQITARFNIRDRLRRYAIPLLKSTRSITSSSRSVPTA
jgi:hypothetical protein